MSDTLTVFIDGLDYKHGNSAASICKYLGIQDIGMCTILIQLVFDELASRARRAEEEE